MVDDASCEPRNPNTSALPYYCKHHHSPFVISLPCVPYVAAVGEEEVPSTGVEGEGDDEGTSIGAIVGIIAGVLGGGLVMRFGCKNIIINCFNRN